ncbi:hypothetical protein Scep_029930 [Stephania cephalantha]|uniref:Uncharacterized protein n=1 Tax=Stephania cephalantha TaxID=152367 RepID=A0AAP0HDX2_9MAGN
MAPTFPPKLCFLITVHQISRFVRAWIKAPSTPPNPQIPQVRSRSLLFDRFVCLLFDRLVSSVSSLIVSSVSALRSSRLSVSLRSPPPKSPTPNKSLVSVSCSQLSLSKIPKSHKFGLGLCSSIVSSVSALRSSRLSVSLRSPPPKSPTPTSLSSRSLALNSLSLVSPSLAQPVTLVSLVSLVSPSLSGHRPQIPNPQQVDRLRHRLSTLSLWSLLLLLGHGSPFSLRSPPTAHRSLLSPVTDLSSVIFAHRSLSFIALCSLVALCLPLRSLLVKMLFACLSMKGYARFAVEMFVKAAELALSLAHKCLSFDFVGTSLDESSEEFGTVCLEASSGGSFKPANLFLLLCNRKTSYLKGGLADHDNYHDEGAVGVNGSHGFEILFGSVVHLAFGLVGDAITSNERLIYFRFDSIVLWVGDVVRGPCFNELREITSLDASSYGYSHIGSLRKMFLRSYTLDVSGLDKTSIIKHLRERTSAPIKEVKSALVNCNWDIEAAQKDLRKRGVVLEAMFVDLGHFSVRSIQSVTELQDGSALFITVAKYLSPSRHDIDQAKHQRRRQELTQTTPDQPLDDEAVYYKVAGDCPKGCVYSLRSLWRKKRRYVDPDASTSQVLAQRGMSNFMILRDGIHSVSDSLLIRDGIETELKNSVSDPLLIRDGSATECMNSVSVPSLISNGSETEEFMHSVYDPLLIRDGTETECMNSVSVPSLISNGSETECMNNCTI